MTEAEYWQARAKVEERARAKRHELARRNKKSPEFLERMRHIRAHDFSVQTADEPPGFVVTVTEKASSEKKDEG